MLNVYLRWIDLVLGLVDLVAVVVHLGLKIAECGDDARRGAFGTDKGLRIRTWLEKRVRDDKRYRTWRMAV